MKIMDTFLIKVVIVCMFFQGMSKAVESDDYIEVMNKLQAGFNVAYKQYNNPNIFNNLASSWNNALITASRYIEDNCKNALGVKDSVIMDSLNKLKKINQTIQLNKKTIQEDIGDLPFRAYKTIVGFRNELISEQNNPALVKLYNGSTTLARKKKAIEVLRKIAYLLASACQNLELAYGLREAEIKGISFK